MRVEDRRAFLRHAVEGVIAGATVPWLLAPARAVPSWSHVRQDLKRAATDDEAFWRLIKGQFPLRDDLILMNAANLCPSPFPVIDTVVRLTREVDADASFQNRAKLADLREAARTTVAAHLGSEPDELAFVRNTSEGNNTVINGLTLGRGDEVVIWDQNHPTCNVAWDVRAQRYGFTVRRVTTPPAPSDPDALIGAFEQALTPRTRLLAFSHVSNVSGVGLPARELCDLARRRGILTLIDGAQTFGALHVHLHAIGCDFYTGSAHKWFVGPKEVGVLYVRRERAADLWPTHVGVGWQNAKDGGARRFETLGQRDDAAVAAMGAAAEFHWAIGVERVERRVRALAAYLMQRLTERWPGVRFHTPRVSALNAGVVVFTLPGLDARDAFGRLYRDHGIGCAAMGGAFEGIRLCPHIYNTREEVDHVVDAVAAVL